MRGAETKQSSMLCLMSPEARVPASHPLRSVKQFADQALSELSPVFDAMYSATGRPSIPPERLLKATLLMALYTVRSERQFCEQLDYNLLFRWFLDMDMVEASFDATAFTRNRVRLLAHDVAGQFFRTVVEQARAERLMSHEHFTVDGTLIDAWASLKSLGADRGYDTGDFVRECRARNVTPHVTQYMPHRSAIDARTTRPSGYAVSQRIRKRVEEVFGWMKTVGNFRKTRYRGLAKSRIAALMVAAAYNLLRMAKLRLNGLARHTALT